MAKRYAAGVIFVAVALLAGCGEMRPVGSSRYFLTHTVETGDTLYSIAWGFGYDYRQVAAWNSIPPPYTIFVGQELVIMAPDRYSDPELDPDEAPAAPLPGAPRGALAGSQAHIPVAPRARAPVAAHKVNKAPAIAPKSARTRPEPPPPREVRAITWQWPTLGKVMAGFKANAGRKGVDLSGKVGQPVVAAAAGDVVYSGNGLIGYGNLVIIKHDDVFLSAYAHNRRLLVKEGERVKAGDTIAEMGQSSKSGSILHFEIRKNGKPVDPLRYLPPQNS